MIYDLKFTTCLLFLLQGHFGLCQTTAHQQYYSIDVPNGWTNISEGKLDSIKKQNYSLVESNLPQYQTIEIIGFAESNEYSAKAPLFLCIYHDVMDYTVYPFDSIVSSYVRRQLENSDSIITVINQQEGKFYFENYSESLWSFMAYAITDRGVVELHYFPEQSHKAIGKSEFLKIYKSLKVKQKHYFRDQVSEAKKNMNKSGQYLLVASVFLFISYLVNKIKR